MTDACLIAIARHYEGIFLTFDARLRTIQSGSNDSVVGQFESIKLTISSTVVLPPQDLDFRKDLEEMDLPTEYDPDPYGDEDPE